MKNFDSGDTNPKISRHGPGSRSFYTNLIDNKRILVTTTGKGGYTAMVLNIHSISPTPLEENHEVIENLNTIVQGMQT